MKLSVKKLHSMKDTSRIFRLLNDKELGIVYPYLEIESYTAGTTLFHEGDPGDSIGIIISGKVRVMKEMAPSKKPLILATLGCGSVVGEFAMLNEKASRSATVVAQENTELIILKRQVLLSLIQSDPSTSIKMMAGLNRIIALRLRKAEERLTRIF